MKLFNKEPLSYQEQLDLLKSRGLIVENDEKALHLLETIGYYRLCGYLYPQLQLPKEDHRFKDESYFESAFKMYKFDRELRFRGILKKLKLRLKLNSPLYYPTDTILSGIPMINFLKTRVFRKTAEKVF